MQNNQLPDTQNKQTCEIQKQNGFQQINPKKISPSKDLKKSLTSIQFNGKQQTQIISHSTNQDKNILAQNKKDNSKVKQIFQVQKPKENIQKTIEDKNEKGQQDLTNLLSQLQNIQNKSGIIEQTNIQFQNQQPESLDQQKILSNNFGQLSTAAIFQQDQINRGIQSQLNNLTQSRDLINKLGISGAGSQGNMVNVLQQYCADPSQNNLLQRQQQFNGNLQPYFQPQLNLNAPQSLNQPNLQNVASIVNQQILNGNIQQQAINQIAFQQLAELNSVQNQQKINASNQLLMLQNQRPSSSATFPVQNPAQPLAAHQKNSSQGGTYIQSNIQRILHAQNLRNQIEQQYQKQKSENHQKQTQGLQTGQKSEQQKQSPDLSSDNITQSLNNNTNTNPGTFANLQDHNNNQKSLKFNKTIDHTTYQSNAHKVETIQEDKSKKQFIQNCKIAEIEKQIDVNQIIRREIEEENSNLIGQLEDTVDLGKEMMTEQNENDSVEMNNENNENDKNQSFQDFNSQHQVDMKDSKMEVFDQQQKHNSKHQKEVLNQQYLMKDRKQSYDQKKYVQHQKLSVDDGKRSKSQKNDRNQFNIRKQAYAQDHNQSNYRNKSNDQSGNRQVAKSKFEESKNQNRLTKKTNRSKSKDSVSDAEVLQKQNSQNIDKEKIEKLFKQQNQQLLTLQSQQSQQIIQSQQTFVLTAQLQSRLKDLEFDNFRLERRLQEIMSRQWRVEQLMSGYVFQGEIKDAFETSQAYLQSLPPNQSAKYSNLQIENGDDKSPSLIEGRPFKTHIVDYLQPHGFKRIQDAINAANSFDKIIVKEGVYTESLYIDKPLLLIANGFVEIRSSIDNVVTCMISSINQDYDQDSHFQNNNFNGKKFKSHNNLGCLIKGFTIRRLDMSKGDPLSTGAGITNQIQSQLDSSRNDENQGQNNQQRHYGNQRNNPQHGDDNHKNFKNRHQDDNNENQNN